MTDIDNTEQADAIDPADLVAELDDEPDQDYADDEGDYDDLEVYRGPVHGGPWDGQQAESRYPKGFLLVDMEHGVLWVYDLRDDGAFYARNTEPTPIDEDGRWRAADGDDFDILVPDIADQEATV